jgi:hypothetical protein
MVGTVIFGFVVMNRIVGGYKCFRGTLPFQMLPRISLGISGSNRINQEPDL